MNVISGGDANVYLLLFHADLFQLWWFYEEAGGRLYPVIL